MSVITDLKFLLYFLLALFLLGGCGSRGYKVQDDRPPAEQTQSTQLPAQQPAPEKQRKQSQSSLFGLQTYGNWCGSNYPANLEHLDEPPKPIDALDAACRRHDYCYLRYGDFDCLCDEVFVQEVDNAIRNNEINGNSRHIGRSFILLFQNSPCTGDSSGKALPSKILHDVYNGAKGIANKFFGNNDDNQQ